MKVKVSELVVFLVVTYSCFCYVNSLIIPDELPSILSLIYSNIPTLKKGTDSRLGWGFRLGDRADFQVLVELGPQLNTQPLANQGDKSNKRNVANNYVNELYAKRQQEKQISNSAGGQFLDQWSKDIALQPTTVITKIPIQKEPTRIQLGIGEIDAKSVIPDESVSRLEELYKNRGKLIAAMSTQKPVTTTSFKDALDNVSLD